MSLNNHPQNLPMARAFLLKALEAEKGVKLRFRTHGLAIAFKQKCNQLRFRDRAQNKKIFQPGDPLYGLSDFDKIDIFITVEESPDGDFAVIAVSNPDAALANMKIEEIT